MEKFSALLAFVRGFHRSPLNSLQRPVTRSFDGFFDLDLDNLEQTMETPVIWDAIVHIMTSLYFCRELY